MVTPRIGTESLSLHPGDAPFSVRGELGLPVSPELGCHPRGLIHSAQHSSR